MTTPAFRTERRNDTVLTLNVSTCTAGDLAAFADELDRLGVSPEASFQRETVGLLGAITVLRIVCPQPTEEPSA